MPNMYELSLENLSKFGYILILLQLFNYTFHFNN